MGFAVGDRVRHRDSGWSGEVLEIREDDSGMRGCQGPLVTVRPTSPRPTDAPPDWAGWKPITVTADELELVAPLSEDVPLSEEEAAVRDGIQKLIKLGLVEIPPEEMAKPWGERVPRLTPLGVEMRPHIEELFGG